MTFKNKNKSKQTAVAVVLLLALCGAAAAADVPTGPVVGIDLGTTYSCVGVYRNGGVEIIPNDQGNRVTPSYVAWAGSERLVGDAAKSQASHNPSGTVFDVKRLVGRQFRDKEVQSDMATFPFAVVDNSGRPYVEVAVDDEQKQFSPEEISAMVLGKMKQIAEDYLGESVHDAVVTVPAYFNDAQRQATRDAGRIAGLNVMRIINEPTAAALAYGMGKDGEDSEKNVLVYDLGGGTFDVSLLTIDQGVFEVLATSGDTHLGGEDFDQRVMAYFTKLLKNKHNIDISGDARATQKLRREVERVKRALSTTQQARVEVEAIAPGFDMSETLTRARFEELNSDLFKKTLKPVAKVLEDSGLKKSEIDEIVMVGGSTRIPKVQQLLKEFFGKELSRGINPDEAVAHGAAVQAGILDPNAQHASLDNMIVLDVTALSLGIETVGGVMTTVVPRTSSIPTKKTQTFSTHADSQTTVSIQVYQGERAMVKDNVLLGKFELSGIPPAPRGVPQIEVSFSIDANGMLTVSAHEQKSGKMKEVNINVKDGRLSDADVKRMQAEAELYAEEDRIARERIDATNALESYLYSLKNALTGGELTFEEEDEEALQEIVDDAIEWLEAMDTSEVDVEVLTEKRSEVERAAGPIMTRAYNNSGGGAAGGDEDEDEDEDWM